MPSLGELRIDLIANIARFVSPFNKATGQIERFARSIAKSMDGMEKSLEKAGRQLSLKVTAPLTAFSIAAVKAADKNGDFADSMERLGRQAQAALEPLGRSLIQAFESIRPQVEDAIRLINGLAQAFEELDPAAKRQIIQIGVFAAAIGPAAVAASVFFTVMKHGATVIAFTAANFGNLVKVIGAATAAMAGFRIGNALERQFPETIQKLVAWTGLFVAHWGAGFEIIAATTMHTFSIIEGAWYKLNAVLMNGIASLVEEVQANASFFEGIISGITGGLAGSPGSLTGGQLASRLRADAKEMENLATVAFDPYLDKLDEITVRLEEKKKQILNVMGTSIDAIRRGDFGGQDARGFWSGLGEDLEKDLTAPFDRLVQILRTELPDTFPQLKTITDLLERARQIAAGVKLPEVITKRDQERLEAAAKAMEKMRDAAQTIIERNNPRARLQRELGEARSLNLAGVLPDEEFLKEAARIKKAMDDLADNAEETFGTKLAKSIEGFSVRVSDAFADLAIDGKAAFDDLAKSFAKMIVSLTFQEQIAGPLASEFGGFIRKAFAGGSTGAVGVAGAGATQAMGGIWNRGQLQAFAVGGVVNGPRLFPMANGGVGLMGEAGPEAIMPLTRIGGKLGVRASMGGGTTVQVIDMRRGGAPVETRETTGPDGRKVVQAIIRDEVKAAVADGSLDRVFGSSFGLNRRGARR